MLRIVQLTLALAAAWLPALGQTELWTSVSAKTGLTKRWDATASFEQRWRSTGYQQFSDLRLTRDARSNWKYFYEFRAPLNGNVRPRHTLALEKTWKPRIQGHKIIDLTVGARYHVNRAARLRLGVYAERKWGSWTPEASGELWTSGVLPGADLRRLRANLGVNWEFARHWRANVGYTRQTDLRRSGAVDAQFSVLRLGLRVKL
ncbi:MAG: DUF2490 domain-containing protein [Schleiferiaceae bacterium]